MTDLSALRNAIDELKTAAQNLSHPPQSDVSQTEIDSLVSEVQSVTSGLSSSSGAASSTSSTSSTTTDPTAAAGSAPTSGGAPPSPAAADQAEKVQPPWATPSS